MARVLVASQPWGLLWEKDGNRKVELPAAGLAASMNTTVYAAATGSPEVPAFVTNDDGELPGYVEAGSWTLTVGAESFAVEAVSGTSALKANLSINAMDYMPTGWVSGTTVVTTEMQAAIDAAAGNELYIPEGAYIIDALLTIPSNTTIRGAGVGSILRRLGTGAALYERILTNSDESSFGANTDIAILNLCLDFSTNTNNHPYNNPIHMRLVDGVLVDGCLIRGGGSGCHVEGCSNVRVVNNRCDSFTDKAISSSQYAGGPTNPTVLIANNTIRQTSASKHAAGSSPLLATQAGTVFANNIVVSTVTLQGFGIEFGDADDSVAVGNTFIGCGVLIGSGDRTRVEGNTFADGAVAGSARIVVQVTGGAANPTRATIKSNDLHCVATSAAVSAISVASTGTFSRVKGNNVSGGGYIDIRAADCTIEGNEVEGSLLHGYIIASAARPVIRDNVARNCGTDSTGSSTTKVGFMFDTLTDPTIEGNLAVSSNVATADMRNGYYLNASTSVRWRDNSSRGHTVGILTITGTPTWDNAQSFINVASAATVTLPGYTNCFNITGTTGITSITATGWTGRIVVLRFAGALTVTDGSNLLLAGNLVTAAQTTLSLFCDGTNWVEISRSTN